MACIVTAYVVMAVMAVCFDLYSSGLSSYGLYSYGLYSYGLYSNGRYGRLFRPSAAPLRPPPFAAPVMAPPLSRQWVAVEKRPAQPALGPPRSQA